MIRIDCEQGGDLWVRTRLGLPTASRFDNIITPKTMRLSESSNKYAWELIAERILRYPVDAASSAFMTRGQVLEKKAVDFYEMRRDCDTEQVGFVLRDDRRVGCSPDRFIGTDGILEIKCPNVQNHIGYLLDAEGIGYRAQVQGQLWIAERVWVDTLSYNPALPPALVRVHRDEDFIKKLAGAVNQFADFVDECMLRLVKLGHLDAADVAPLRVA